MSCFRLSQDEVSLNSKRFPIVYTDALWGGTREIVICRMPEGRSLARPLYFIRAIDMRNLQKLSPAGSVQTGQYSPNPVASLYQCHSECTKRTSSQTLLVQLESVSPALDRRTHTDGFGACPYFLSTGASTRSLCL